MNDYLLAALLGVVEGLTEFLPVSSTAHLRIFQAMAGVDLEDGYWKMFAIVIQLGAIASLPIFFRKRLWDFVSTFPKGEHGDRTLMTHPLTLIGIAFMCTMVPSFLAIKLIGKNLESLSLMGKSLLVGGVVMWAIDAIYSKKPQVTQRVDDASLPQAVWIGLCQTVSALFPGTSRSMATIAAGQVGGLSRTAALEFSFLLSIPTMVAATAYDLLKSLKGGSNAVGAQGIDGHGVVLLLIGMVVSFVVAYGVVAWFMGWVRNRGFVPFAVYRIAAGAALLMFGDKLGG